MNNLAIKNAATHQGHHNGRGWIVLRFGVIIFRIIICCSLPSRRAPWLMSVSGGQGRCSKAEHSKVNIWIRSSRRASSGRVGMHAANIRRAYRTGEVRCIPRVAEPKVKEKVWEKVGEKLSLLPDLRIEKMIAKFGKLVRIFSV